MANVGISRVCWILNELDELVAFLPDMESVGADGRNDKPILVDTLLSKSTDKDCASVPENSTLP